ncbi:MAG: dynamin family protein [Nocardioidaceae bacterium]
MSLGEMADGADRVSVEELLRRLEADLFRVVVAGEAKRGKSTLINAMLGQEVLPMGVVPLTAIPTTVAHGPRPELILTFADGRRDVRPLAELAEYVTEAGNPRNQWQVSTADVRLPAPLLASGVELVDTPGTGSVHDHNTAQAHAARERMDARSSCSPPTPRCPPPSAASWRSYTPAPWPCSAC